MRDLHSSTDKRMLAPIAYNETALPSLRLARSSRLARRVGKVLFVLMTIGTVIVCISPWQQTVKGTGTVIAYAPFERQQTIETPIKGRITRLGEGIYENAHVVKGALIAEVADIDEQYFRRLQDQLEASQRQVEASEDLHAASIRNRDAAMTIVETFQSQVETYKRVKEQVVLAADANVMSATDKVEAERQQLAEYEAALTQIQANFDRQKLLFEDNIVSELKFQEVERKLREAEAKVAKSKAYVSAAENELSSKRSERIAKAEKAQVDIEYATAAVRKASADIAKAESSVAKASADLNKAQKDLLETETKVARQMSQEIRAPFNGFVTSITPNQGSKILKEGDPICVIVPDTDDRAVQIWLDGNDAPLVQAGRHVRLQFEGWPAVQFAGYPSVAVGTFGGQVVSVDATDNGKGKFRALVLPDEDHHTAWPNSRYLRQGVRANGWVLLDRVPLWYEIWRNMNGFPPSITQGADKDGKGPKPPKLPKP